MANTALLAPGSGAAPGNSPRTLVRLWGPRFAAPAVGLLAAVIAFAGSGTPSYWGDEAASVLTGGRSLPSLFSVLGHIDAVHGVYYLFLHFWMQLFGTSELAVRLPSAIAVGLAASGVLVMGRMLFGMRVGVVAAIVFAVLPIVTRMGLEARSYAMGMAAAVWLTVLVIALVRRGEARRSLWVLYALGLAASVYLFLYLALLIVVHLAVVVAYRSPRAVRRLWVRAEVLAVVLALPILVVGYLEREQIKFLANRDYATVKSVLVGQWFGTPVVAVVAWALIAIALAGFVRSWGSAARPGAGAAASPAARLAASPAASLAARPAAVILLAWLVLPTMLLLAANFWITPSYNLRYLAFCAPAAALLIAWGVEELAGWGRAPRIRTAITVLVVGVLIAAVVPGYLAQRGPFAKDGGSDLRQTAEAIAANAVPGDAVIFDQQTKPSRSPRLALDLYPGYFSGLDDIGLVTPLAQRDSLWDEVAPLSALGDQLAAHTTVWVVQLGSDQQDVSALRERGYTVQATIPVHRMVIYKLSKE